MVILREEAVESVGDEVRQGVVHLAETALRSGHVIAYPTETLYGLGADYESEAAYRKIMNLKGLSEVRPLILLIPDVGWLDELSLECARTPFLASLVKRFWPGPLTLMLPASPSLPEYLVGRERLVSLRLSSDPFVRDLLASYRRPITSTSANPSGKTPAATASDLRAYFSILKETIDLLVDDGMRNGPPSTLVKVEGERCRVMREGAILEVEISDSSRS